MGDTHNWEFITELEQFLIKKKNVDKFDNHSINNKKIQNKKIFPNIN